MEKRINISSGAQWENKVGYSRAVRIGNLIEISGTVALKNGTVEGIHDPYQQTKAILKIIEETLDKAGSNLSQVIRTRMYVIDISQWEEIGRAHGEVFGKIKPATTMVEVSRLISPEFLLEIEATALDQ